MEEWKEYKLGDVANVQTGPFGSQLHNKDYVLRGTPIVTVEHLGEREFSTQNLPCVSEEDKARLRKYTLKEGDIVYSRVGSVDRCSYVSTKENGWLFSGRCLRVRSDISVCSLFLYYYLQQENVKQSIRNIAVGATMPSINTKLLSEIRVSTPSLNIQKRIASILSSLDDKIEVNRKINENLEQQAQALFKSWFVDFEPFKNGEFVESELGMIPKGWRVYTMEELVDRVGGYSYKGNELQESTTAMATIKNFERNGGFKINGFKEIVPSSKAKHEQFLKKFDVIIAHTDLTQNADIIGNPALILHFGKYDRLIMSMDLVKVKSKSDYITYGLLYCFFSDARFKSHALGYVNGTTVLHLSKKAIPDYKLALPNDLSILAKFGKTFDSIFAKEAEMMEETDRLATLRDTLLPKLMSGELKVGDVLL